MDSYNIILIQHNGMAPIKLPQIVLYDLHYNVGYFCSLFKLTVRWDPCVLLQCGAVYVGR